MSSQWLAKLVNQTVRSLRRSGVAVLGGFVNVIPAPAALHALERLLAWKLSLPGVRTHGRVTVEVNPADAFYTPFGLNPAGSSSPAVVPV